MVEDILSCQGGSFTVNLGGPLTVNIVGAWADLETPDNRKWFAVKDNLNFLSVAVTFPHCYCGGDTRMYIELAWQDETVPVWMVLPGFGDNGLLWLYSENVEIPLTNFLKYDDLPAITAGDRYKLGARVGIAPPIPNVSMANVPAAHDTEVMPVFITAKLDHTVVLTI